MIKEKPKSSFARKLFKFFAIPCLLFFSMGYFNDDSGMRTIIGFSVYAYFIFAGFLMVLGLIIKAIKFIFRLKKINIFKEGKTLVIQLFLGRIIKGR